MADLAEDVGDLLAKGDRVVVLGRLRLWERPEVTSGCQVLVDGQWRQVDMVIETKRADGVGVIWLYFE